MDSPYILGMKSLTRAASAVAAVLFSVGAVWADFPAFLVLQDGSFVDQARAVEAAGARIRQQVPPHILVVDLPDGSKPRSIPGVQIAYTSAVPAASLSAQGPAAVAAALQWNRQLMASTRASAPGLMGAMRQTVADQSLPAPLNVRLSAKDNHLVCDWQAVDGAVYYEIQAAGSRTFDEPVIKDASLATHVEMAPPEGAPDVFVRIRAVDPNPTNAAEDIAGHWSEPTDVTISPLAPASNVGGPTVTSPVDGIETHGFLLNIEWMPTETTRVQVAHDSHFADVVLDEIVSGGTYACPEPAFHIDDQLYYRVQAWNGGSRSAWSQVRSAKIGSPSQTKIDSFVNPEAPK